MKQGYEMIQEDNEGNPDHSAGSDFLRYTTDGLRTIESSQRSTFHL